MSRRAKRAKSASQRSLWLSLQVLLYFRFPFQDLVGGGGESRKRVDCDLNGGAGYFGSGWFLGIQGRLTLLRLLVCFRGFGSEQVL